MAGPLTRADLLLAENIRALIAARRVDASALAMWCQKKPAWISKILNGDRGMRVVDIGRVADFFGLTVSEIFQPGISALTERRRQQRRTSKDRRVLLERRSGTQHAKITAALHKVGGYGQAAEASYVDSSRPDASPDYRATLNRIKDGIAALESRLPPEAPGTRAPESSGYRDSRRSDRPPPKRPRGHS